MEVVFFRESTDGAFGEPLGSHFFGELKNDLFGRDTFVRPARWHIWGQNHLFQTSTDLKENLILLNQVK